MKIHFSIFLSFFVMAISAQTDYSSSWEDFYSYNNVKDFVKVDNTIYALVDNAVFTYNTATLEIEKLSSVQGLSGEVTTSIYYSSAFKRLVIGYENGLVEVVDEDGSITISSDILNFNQSGEKSINHITEFNNKLYLATPFAIVVYDIEKLEFGDTYFIGNNSGSIKINQIAIFNSRIYAATETGIFNADITSSLLIDFNNWQQQFSGRNFSQITVFNNQLHTTEGTRLYLLDAGNLIENRNFFQEIKAIKPANSHLSISLNNSAIIVNTFLNEVFQFTINTDFNYTLNNAFFEDNTLFLATKEFGLLSTTGNQTTSYLEIHPEGPFENDVFDIASQNNNLWIVYGGYSGTYAPNLKKQGFSHFNGEKWVNVKYDSNFPVKDLSHISIDPDNDNRVFISSFGSTTNLNSISTGGLLEVENDEIKTFYNQNNSPLEDIDVRVDNVSIRVAGTAFDRNGNLWVSNVGVSNELKKLSSSGQWSSIDLSSLTSNRVAIGLTEVVLDRSNSVWIGTRRNGVYIYNDNGARKKVLVNTANLGNLSDLNVRTIAVDASNRVWLGTRSGMVVYNNASGIFDDENPNAAPVIIEENGVGEKLLGDQTINSIVVDGADNKWFGTDNGGVLYTNPNGQTTLANFSKQNSPLPSNRIVKITVDNSSGKVYFATDKGIVAYNSKVVPFGDVLGDVYAYPNPALKNHETVTIDGRNGTHLPKGTNVKIIDVAGNLVFESNVVEGQELQGGKVVWNKKNLAGTNVASGIYIVLLSNDDASETTFTKIAIVN
jgi:ligand-binding sensor domain-containing protein